MEIEQAWRWGAEQLPASSHADPLLSARLLLQHILQKSHTTLIAFGEIELTSSQLKAYQKLIKQAEQGVPIPYLTGVVPFFGRDFRVSPAVLIPRPETEELTELAIAWLRDKPNAVVVDAGTGSGCIAVTLACEYPDLQLVAVDISEPALAVAKENGAIHAPKSPITFVCGDLVTPIAGMVDLIVANLPYVAETERDLLPLSVAKYEPAIALFAGNDGCDLIRRLLGQAGDKLNDEGAILLEIGYKQGEKVPAIAREYFPSAQVTLRADYAGKPRFVIIQTS